MFKGLVCLLFVSIVGGSLLQHASGHSWLVSISIQVISAIAGISLGRLITSPHI